jgi:small subunit ribosomal protein S6
MRIYEELFILKPDATEEEVAGLVSQLEGVITSLDGTIDKIDKWGVRKLAYKVQKKSEGFYVLMVFRSEPVACKELERRLRVSDLVMKHMTVRMDEKMKWLEKRQKARSARAARKPAPSIAPPGAPMPAPGAPAMGGVAAAPMPAAPAGPTPGAPAPGAPAAPAPAAPAEVVAVASTETAGS